MNAKISDRHFSIITLGCRVNQCESDSLAQHLTENGWIDPGTESPRDLVVVNTCAVTGKAAMQSRQAVRRAVREHPGAKIVVTGCYAQTAPEDFQNIKGVGAVCGNAEKCRIPEMIAQDSDASVSDIALHRSFDPVRVPFSTNRTRPVLKIQDGCNAFCTYCIVPHARGRSRSMPEADVVSHVRLLEKAGFCEVVLSGIHLGAYGMDFSPQSSLKSILQRIERETSIPRIRLSSIEPGELDTGIIELAASSDRICPHFHVPLQSGDNEILRKMGRPYSAEAFEDLIFHLRRQVPDAAIGADVLVGFPGETTASFHRTHSLIERTPLTYLHVFPFSARPGTPAFHFSGRISHGEIQERCRQLRETARRKRIRFLDAMVGRRLSALVESKRDPGSGHLKATTPNYATVLLEGPDSLKNRIVSCRIQRRIDELRVLGEIAVPEAVAD
ncbi:MAG: tRNA (N(6)-L-threonylcarbamoyladenosine(37)-C(2))-methylthiotransferase MtaB [Desulfobacterales bacterium]|jgi:threonylcarbamoyladenosine tRNA methylthiotransferase MtaB